MNGHIWRDLLITWRDLLMLLLGGVAGAAILDMCRWLKNEALQTTGEEMTAIDDQEAKQRQPAEHTFKLILPVDPCMASIEMDGKPMNGVTRIDLSVSANALTTVKLTMWAHVEVEGELRDSEIIHVERSRDV